MNKKLGIIVAVLITLLIVGCSAQNEAPAEPVSTGEVQTTEKSDTAKEVRELKIQHKLGEITLNKTPEKVVVFDYGTVDSLDKMGIDVIALPKSHVPPYLEKFKSDQYVSAGSLFEPDFEKIYELKPDLIIISPRQAKSYEEFIKIAPTLYVETDSNDYINSFKKNIMTLGKIFEKEDFVNKEFKALEESINSINKKVTEAGKRAVVIMVNDGALSVFGKGSRFDSIYKEFGFGQADENIEVSNHGQSISFEYIAEKDPEYIFVVDRGAVVGGNVSAKQVLENDIVKEASAYKNGNIIYLDSFAWYVSTGGFGSTAIMVEDVMKATE